MSSGARVLPATRVAGTRPGDGERALSAISAGPAGKGGRGTSSARDAGAVLTVAPLSNTKFTVQAAAAWAGRGIPFPLKRLST